MRISASTGSVRSFQGFLRRNSLTFACAESCTGGLLAREMTGLAGASDVFWGAVVSYANAAKTALLGVPPGLIDEHGAVSGPVAIAMVQGMVSASGVALAVSITGVAGPGGGSDEKPVGTVWFGLAARRSGIEALLAVRCRFSGPRLSIQRQSSRMARVLARCWWESAMDLDSFRSLTDNECKSSLEAFQHFLPFPPNSF